MKSSGAAHSGWNWPISTTRKARLVAAPRWTVASLPANPETVKHKNCEVLFMKNITVSVDDETRRLAVSERPSWIRRSRHW